MEADPKIEFALVRGVPNSMIKGLSKDPLHKTFDLEKAKQQHQSYIQNLKKMGIISYFKL